MIFYDIDATLIDHERAEKLGALEFYRVYAKNLYLNEKNFIGLWSSSSKKYFEMYLAKQLSFEDQRRMRMKALFGQHLSNEQCDQRFKDYLNFYKENWNVFDDVIPCLKKMKCSGWRLGIISNGQYSQQVEKLTKVGILDYFDMIVTSSETGVAKPDKEIFIQACVKAKANVHECFYVGDNFESDVLGSHHAGMKGIWINRNDSNTHPEHIVIHCLDELETVIRGA